MTRKEYELTIGTVMFPAITKEDLQDVIGDQSLEEFINKPEIHISETQRESVKTLLEYFDGLAQSNMIIEMKSVESSNVGSIGYDPITNTMYVVYKSGGRYSYKDVPLSVYQRVLNAESVGKAIYEVKSNYEAEKVN